MRRERRTVRGGDSDVGRPRRNLELKVACRPEGLALRRELLARAGIPVDARLWQRDVYFKVPDGRLKLRWMVRDHGGESRISAELITYARPDEAASRWSDYSVEPVALDMVDALETKLLAAHGVLAIIVKQRVVALWGATRIHLDEVEVLGCFIELETVLTDQSEADADQEHQAVIRALQLDELPVVAGSYSDLRLDRWN
jgi:adenylate cyclase class IV